MTHDLTVPWKSCRFAAFDLETTGTDIENDRIIEIGLVVFDNGEIVDSYSQLIDPEVQISAEVTGVTGITNDDVRGKPKLAEVLDDFVGRLTSQVLLAYNHTFDLGIVRSELRRMGRTVEMPACLDPLPFCWEHLRNPGLTSNAKLGTVTEYMRIPLEAAHRAVHDAEAAGRVMLRLPDYAVLPEKLSAILQLQRVTTQRMEESYARFRRNREGGRSVFSGELIIELGAAFAYGHETDPVKALFMQIPDARDM